MPMPSRSQVSRRAAESVSERVYLAVKHLATSQGDVRDRLKGAGLTLMPLMAREFPNEVRNDFEWVIQQLTRYEPRFKEGRIEATMNRIRNPTGEKIAERIFDMYEKIQDIRGRPLL